MSYIQLNNNIIELLQNTHIKTPIDEPSALYSNLQNNYQEIFNKHHILCNPIISHKIQEYLLCDKSQFIATFEQLRLIANNTITINNNKIYYNETTYRKMNNNYIIKQHPYFININDKNELVNIDY